MLIAFILMQQFGVSANLMSLAGLAIGTGMMVDGAVVMVENAFRLLSHARESGKPINKTHLILEAAREVINPIAFAIMIIIVVFLPLFSLTGLEGKLFKPMALTITFAMAGSLLLSMTLVPVLAALILKPKEEKDTFVVRWAKKRLPAAAGLGTGAQEAGHRLCRGAAGRLAGAVPVPRQGVHADAAGGHDPVPRDGIPSTSLDESIRVSNVVSDELHKQFPQVVSVLATIGRAEGGETTDVNYMEINLATKPQSEWPEKMPYAEARRRDAGGDGEGRADRRVRRDAADPVAGRGTDLRRARDAGAEALWRRPGDAGQADGADQGRAGQGARRRRPVGRGQQGQAAAGHQGQPRGGFALRHQCRRDPGGRAGRHRRRARSRP